MKDCPGGIQIPLSAAAFAIAGGNPGRRADPTKDENTVIFNSKQQPGFAAIRAAVESAVANRNTPAAAPAAGDRVSQLARLAEMHESGALSDDEFTQAKARLLDGP